MTFNREPISWVDHKETCEAYAELFRKGELTELDYRKKLNQLGFSPTEADAEVATNKRD